MTKNKKWSVLSLVVIVLICLSGILTPALASDKTVPALQNPVQGNVADAAISSSQSLFGSSQFTMQPSNYNMFLQLTNIKGESYGIGHEDWIEVLSFKWGLSQPRSIGQSGSGAATGRTQVLDFSFSHLLDRASPLLMSACAQGKIIPDATFHVVSSGETSSNVKFYELKMSNVAVSSVNLSGNNMVKEGTPTGKPVEDVTLSFTKIVWTYWQIKSDGSPGDTLSGSYDLTRGR